MCGIAGVVSMLVSGDLRATAERMQKKIRHRGPDGDGLFEDSTGRAALVHTRLAILDLSAAGHQPMLSACGRYVIAFNGEIYNFRKLRTELAAQGVIFRTGTDTEVLLQLYVAFGEECVHRLEGMFAFAIWDTFTQTLFLARDPLGIKPVYVWQVGSTLAFASELGAVLASGIGPIAVEPHAVFDYLRFGSVQEPATLVQSVTLLGAGHCLTWSNGVAIKKRYWRLEFGQERMDSREAITRTRDALEESIERHFVSDVPVGLFLSGGIDSTAIVATARSLGHRNLRTFCISFDDKSFNEGNLAARTADYFETEHVDWRMSAEDGQSMVQGYLDAMDQPSSDGFNTYCVSRLAHDNGMKVVLSGLGGDELFAGYPSFQKIPRLLALHQGSRFLPGSAAAAHLLARGGRNLRVGRIADFLDSPGSVVDAWSAMRGFFTASEAKILVKDWLGLEFDLTTINPECSVDVDSRSSIADQISACEMTGYMRNQLLRDSDVMSMRWGLELRVPFVDRRLIESVGRISSTQRLAFGKKLLVAAVSEIPEWILSQPKRGFAFPFEQWVLNEWKATFDEVSRTSPVPTVTWYRTWCLFVLRHFLKSSLGLNA